MDEIDPARTAGKLHERQGVRVTHSCRSLSSPVCARLAPSTCGVLVASSTYGVSGGVGGVEGGGGVSDGGGGGGGGVVKVFVKAARTLVTLIVPVSPVIVTV